jgi:hypothetical protein
MAQDGDPDVTADWYWKGNVVGAIARFLANDGWTIVGKAHTHLRSSPTPKPSRSLPASPNETILCVRLSPL